MSLMVSISGVRGVVGEDLSPNVILKYSGAFAEYCNRGTVVIGRDGRISGKVIGNLVSSALLSMGCDVVALGVVPTPTVQIAVEQLRADGGISITASHNPVQWNGLKFLGKTGMFLNATENKRLMAIADRGNFSYSPWNKMGKYTPDDTFIWRHIDMVTQLPYVHAGEIRERGFKVVVDCVNAAGGMIVPRLLRKLGCTVIEMNCDVSGVFARTPEPIPENLKALCRRVRAEGADLGIAVDPDVDRLVLITERGEPFGEEYTITSVVDFILPRIRAHKGSIRLPGKGPNRSPSVVVNLSTTRAVDDVARKFGARVIRTPVGEINVAQRMKEVGAIVGGEGSGGVILPAVHYGRDAIVGIALILQHLYEFGGTLSELKATLPRYVITKSKVTVASKNVDRLLDRIRRRNEKKGTVNVRDGLKIDFADSWVHLRKSNTEPIIRIIAEAPSKRRSRQLVAQFTRLIKTS